MDKELEKAATDRAIKYFDENEDVLTQADYENGFIAGALWQKQQSPWISVKDRLPEIDDDFYFCLSTKMNPPGIDACEYSHLTRFFSRNGVIVRPTHWMPIPEFPKE